MGTTNNSGLEFWANGNRVEILDGPVTDGEVARQALADGKVIPIIGLTGGAMASLQEACKRTGTTFTFVEVTERLERVTSEESDADLHVRSFQAVIESAEGDDDWAGEPTCRESDAIWISPYQRQQLELRAAGGGK